MNVVHQWWPYAVHKIFSAILRLVRLTHESSVYSPYLIKEKVLNTQSVLGLPWLHPSRVRQP